MTRHELNEISKEGRFISDKLDLLDPNNLIESKERTRLFRRLDFLEYKLDCTLYSIRRSKFRVITN